PRWWTRIASRTTRPSRTREPRSWRPSSPRVSTAPASAKPLLLRSRPRATSVLGSYSRMQWARAASARGSKPRRRCRRRSASRAGGPKTRGPHGSGPFGDLVRAELAREGIDMALLPDPRLDTGWTIAMIEPDGERTFVTVTGADAIVESSALATIDYVNGDAVYVSGYDLAYPGAGQAIAEHV